MRKGVYRIGQMMWADRRSRWIVEHVQQVRNWISQDTKHDDDRTHDQQWRYLQVRGVQTSGIGLSMLLHTLLLWLILAAYVDFFDVASIMMFLRQCACLLINFYIEQQFGETERTSISGVSLMEKVGGTALENASSFEVEGRIARNLGRAQVKISCESCLYSRQSLLDFNS
jgi:hypothetical protein